LWRARVVCTVERHGSRERRSTTGAGRGPVGSGEVD
jgi:hypothetical protein